MDNIRTRNKEVRNAETGEWEVIKIPFQLSAEKIKSIEIEVKQVLINEKVTFLSQTDNKIKRFDRQEKLGLPTKYSESQILAIEISREVAVSEIEDLELEIELLKGVE